MTDGQIRAEQHCRLSATAHRFPETFHEILFLIRIRHKAPDPQVSRFRPLGTKVLLKALLACFDDCIGGFHQTECGSVVLLQQQGFRPELLQKELHTADVCTPEPVDALIFISHTEDRSLRPAQKL